MTAAAYRRFADVSRTTADFEAAGFGTVSAKPFDHIQASRYCMAGHVLSSPEKARHPQMAAIALPMIY